MAACASPRSPDGRAATLATSSKVTTATRSVSAPATAALAAVRALSNCPGARSDSEASSATTVSDADADDSPDAKNGRAKAIASRRSAATRSKRRRISFRCRRRACSTGARRKRLTAENLIRASGSRLSRCSTMGTAAASAPNRNRGDRNDSMPSALHSLGASRQVGQQRDLERLLGADETVVDAARAEVPLVLCDQAVHLREVVLSHDRRNGHDLLAGLEILEAGGTLERKLDF